jgi:hypothetical protein
MNKKIIGRVDKVDFPKLNLYNVNVKIDTGAYTSTIHCNEYIEENNCLKCSFNSIGETNIKNNDIIFENYSRTNVKSSNGIMDSRYKIKSEIIFFGKTYKINLTLSTRSDMKFPVLIGRQFLNKKFLVDVDLENQSYMQRKI